MVVFCLPFVAVLSQTMQYRIRLFNFKKQCTFGLLEARNIAPFTLKSVSVLLRFTDDFSAHSRCNDPPDVLAVHVHKYTV